MDDAVTREFECSILRESVREETVIGTIDGIEHGAQFGFLRSELRAFEAAYQDDEKTIASGSRRRKEDRLRRP